MITLIKRKYWTILVLLFLTTFLCIVSYAEVGDLIYSDPLPDKEFKSKNSTSLVQDQNGFIWIGTNDGLYCFKGNNLSRYFSGGTDSTSLYDNRIEKLFIDDSGMLWIVSVGGVCTYNPCLDNFNRILNGFEVEEGAFRQISGINQDKNGKIYFSAENSIYSLNAEQQIHELVFNNPSMWISDFLFDDKNNMWISSNNGGLAYFNTIEKTTKSFLNDKNDSNSLSNNSVFDISLEENSKIWIATYGGGINVLDTKTQKIKRFATNGSYSDYVIYTYLDHQKNIWVCDLSGVRRYDKKSDSFIAVPGFDSAGELIEEHPSQIFQDRQGNYWTVNSPGGVGLRYNSKGITIYDENPSKFWHTINNNISAIAFDKNGACWIGSGNDGIDMFDFKNSRHRIYQSDPDNATSVGQGAVCCLYSDSQNRMWVGTNLGGLQCYDPVNDNFITYLNDPQDSFSISNNDIRGIQEDTDGNFWIVTHGKGIDYFNYKEQKFYNYDLLKNGLSNNWPFQILLDSDENLWVGTPSGVNVLKKGETKFTTYYHVATNPNTTPSDYINCIFEDSQKRIWIGTFSGLCRYNPESNDFIRVDPGFPGQNICSVEEDQNGNLWVCSVAGITGFNPENEQIITILDEADGLPAGMFKPGSSAINTDNVLFFGGDEGITSFNPEELVMNDDVPDVYICGIYVQNKKVERFGENQIMVQSPLCTDKIELNHKMNSIDFEFTSPNFINPTKNKFKYKLEGLDSEWIETEHSHVTYNYLPDGKYVFRVTAANNDGVWNNDGASITVVVNPPWWFTWWFLTILGLLLVLLVVIILRYRLAKLKAEKYKLEGLILDRTKVLNDKNRILEKQKEKLHEKNDLLKQQKRHIEKQSAKIAEVAENLSQINTELTTANATKDKLFSIIAHDLISPFNAILGFSEVLTEEYKTMDDKNRMELIHHVHNSSRNAFDLLHNLLHWARSQDKKIEFEPENINVADIISNATTEVASLALNKKISIESQLKNNDLLIFFDKNMIKLILRNLLMNAIKFSNPDSRIYINAEHTSADMVLFSVQDFGIGMDAETAVAIFGEEGNLNLAKGTSGEKGVGLGLSLCKEFVTSHGGEIWVESKLGEGSTFFFTIQGKQ
ncbi:two-component regulator propeller domain-containing protein [Draconibacterium sp. IB214405]|uniref:ligand-binding sensor domain-containing protein n=1 Tax=Draconibacterium sp. IB214405 TaxID=3097352 RepID=UPI002A1786F8|nr:two-component regulator propeller domain-containing protein [Draconibacterium sp. IB214405]MDX8339877.1 two-component regulator propeller domain-containing protein [Draconibacterium sp. IB214405]